MPPEDLQQLPASGWEEINRMICETGARSDLKIEMGNANLSNSRILCLRMPLVELICAKHAIAFVNPSVKNAGERHLRCFSTKSRKGPVQDAQEIKATELLVLLVAQL